ncbi:cytidylyltransferase domain-containing protein [Solidesulfovibrio alcoholivorans]|uniref:RraA family protein n=1 Tax=Solidesulfovibrio alcoholivorans TaxID=81406 RepID=UPI0005C1B052|nr:cytidyltransferase [Solidesulfovibrio alcoholivorans]
MKVVAFLPAKGSSSRIESKNIHFLDGKPLFLHTLEKLMSCDFIDEVYFDTESDDMIQMASETGCKILKRDSDLATNKTDGNLLFMNEVRHVGADIYIQILCTSPFISVETIKKGVDILKNDRSNRNDSIVLVRKEKLYTWRDSESPNYDLEHIPNSKELDDTIIETMGLYIITRDAALATCRRIGNSPYLLSCPPLEGIDINWPEDFDLANLIAAGLREKKQKLFSNIKNISTTCLISDILDDIGYPNQIIKGLTPNIEGVKIFGRSKTLKLRKLNENEDFKGIYDALRSYESIVANDIIVVENSAPEFAYFGELNANLAMRAGACGVILNGKTRDSIEVKKMGFPVFSSGYTCQDVRRRATVEHYNRKISIQGVTILPGDLIFADQEGVAIIPKEIEQKVFSELLKRHSNENKILVDIASGNDTSRIADKYGFF